jgi:hypothetical protein
MGNFIGLELAKVTWSGIDPVNGFHAVQVDVYGQRPGMDPWQLSHTYGFLSRPLDPDPDGGRGCSAFYYRKGQSEGFAWLANDPRVQDLLPEILPGESFQYGAKGQFVRCHPDGKISIFTTSDATPNGQSVYQQVAPTGFTRVAPWGRETFDANGFHVKHVSGARIDLGAIGGLSAPLDALNSYVTLSAQAVHIEAALVTLGPADGAGMPAAKATVATAVFSALAGVLTALEAPSAFVSPNGPCSAGPGLIAAIEAARSAIATAATTLPSSVMVS